MVTSGFPEAYGWLVTVAQLLILLHWLVAVCHEQPGLVSEYPLAQYEGHSASLRWGCRYPSASIPCPCHPVTINALGSLSLVE